MGFRGAVALVACLAGWYGCRCAPLRGEVNDVAFTRCAQVPAPSERTVRMAALELNVQERVLSIRAQPGLRVAAFTGPVGGSLRQLDSARLAEHKPGLILYLGGLGDTVAAASANLANVAALHVPVLFVAGGADRLPVIEDAFASLDDERKQYVMHGSGLREVRIAGLRMMVVAGAPQGRYAVDADACGFTDDDLEAVREAAQRPPSARQTWLLSWAAPTGWGVSNAQGYEVGSPALLELAKAVSARGGIFAYPETQSGTVTRAGKQGWAMVVPRLGHAGVSRADGSRVSSSLLLLRLTEGGLVPES